MSGSMPMPSATASGQSPYRDPTNGTAARPKPLSARHTPTIGQSDFSQIVAFIPRPSATACRPGPFRRIPRRSQPTPRHGALDRDAGNSDDVGRRPTMDKFTTLEGVAAPIDLINVDTDMIIPKQYLKTIKRTG